MKKVTDFIKPNILIIFGALLLLFFLNYLQYQGGTLAIGIIAVVMSAYYLAVGILSIILGDKLPKRVLDIVSVAFFPAFMFTLLLIQTIQATQIENLMGPTAWIIAILSMVASLGLLVIYLLAKLMNQGPLNRFAYLFAAIFTLALLLYVLFDVRGNSVVLGNLDMILVAIFVSYVFYLFSALGNSEEAPKAAVAEQKAVEEQPEKVVEEQPEEVVEEQPEEAALEAKDE